MQFSNTYLNLGESFYQRVHPTAVANPRLLLWNQPLAEQLGVVDTLSEDNAALAQVFSGNQLLPGAEPIALAYAGHQFGQFVPQLGDGRAHLLGEIIDREGQRKDVQLKGSGCTQYSRAGDGRCALGPALREFIMSEAIHSLGVPTTRCLAVVATGEPVFRETPLPGAVVTRVASSHLRVGTFQFFAARGDTEALKALADYTIKRHFAELQELLSGEKGPERYIALLGKVIERQIQLVVHWMRVGFIHGVMNTDNTLLCGETIDYGPCAMMGRYYPGTVYSSIDVQGRYAYSKQRHMAHWNMARFAECLLPLVDADQQGAIDKLAPLINGFSDKFEQAFIRMMGAKLGLASVQQEDKPLIEELLAKLESEKMDYTITFNDLTASLHSQTITEQMKMVLGGWYEKWQQRLKKQGPELKTAEKLMRQHNPVVIPRNHQVEAVLSVAEQTGDLSPVEDFLKVLYSPYQTLPETINYQVPPDDGDSGYRTFCGT